MTFIAEALGSWLVEELASSARRRIIDWFMGSDQERALRAASAAAVEQAAASLLPEADDEQRDHFALVINHVFEVRADMPWGDLTGLTLLESLQASLREQLAVLDDTDLTGTDTSAAAALGMTADRIADNLSRGVVQQILIRGSSGGPLAALGAQLNHDLTHLQGQRTEGLLKQLIGELSRFPVFAGGPEPRQSRASSAAKDLLGGPMAHIDPIGDLEIHRVIEPAPPWPAHSQLNPLLPLPPYVERDHDRDLRRIVDSSEIRSQAIFLIADSSAGKTRALWEAVQRLPPTWRLWRPFDREELLDAIAERRVGARTVIWLNETQRFVNTAGHTALGEEVAVALRRMLADTTISPLLVVGTLWREHAATLMAIPAASSEDVHEQARALFKNQVLALPEEFDETDLSAAKVLASTDSRLAEALSRGESRVAQYLAGARELIARYETAPIEAKALIDAAVDFARLGGSRIPEGWLREVSASYISSEHWRSRDGAWRQSWFLTAVEYAGRPCRGVPGPVTLVRGSSTDAPQYQVADYLRRQLGELRARANPPPIFWSALSKHVTDHDDLQILGTAAATRGYLRVAETLRTISFLDARPDDGTLAEGALSRRLEKGDWDNAESLARAVSVVGGMNPWGQIIEYRARHEAWPGTGAMIRLCVRSSDVDDWRNALFVAEQSNPGNHAELAYDVALAAEATGASIWPAVVRSALLDNDVDLAERSAAGAERFLDPSGWLALARFHREGGRAAKAATAARAAARLGHVEELEELVRHFAATGAWVEAKREAAAATAAGSARAWRLVADAQLSRGLYEDGELALTWAVSAGDRSAWAAIARHQLARRHWSAAARAAKHAVADLQTSGWSILSLLWDLAGDSHRAEGAAASSGQVGQWLMLASAHCGEGTDRAEQVCRDAAVRGDALPWQVLAQLREFEHELGSACNAWLAAARVGAQGAWARAVDLAFDGGAREQAREIAREAMDTGKPHGWLRLVQRADVALTSQESLQVAREAAAAGVGDVWVELCQSRSGRGDVDGAVLVAEAANTAECWSWLAGSRFSADDVKRAEAIAHRAAEFGHAGAWAALARTASMQGDLPLTLRFWRLAALSADAGDRSALSYWKSAVTAALELGDFNTAEQIVQHIGGSSLWHLLAVGYSLGPDPELGRRHAEVERRAIEEGDLSAYERLPFALIKTGELDDAEQASRIAVERGLSAPWAELVMAYEADERAADAERVARTLRDSDVWESLARYRLDTGDSSGAAQAQKAGRELGGLPDSFAVGHGWSDYSVPEYGDAFAHAFDTLRLWGIEPDGERASPWSLHVPLSAVFCAISHRSLKRGEFSAALEVARHASVMDPTSPDARALTEQTLLGSRQLAGVSGAQPPHGRDWTVDISQDPALIPIKILGSAVLDGSELSVLVAKSEGSEHLELRLGPVAAIDFPSGGTRSAESSYTAAFLNLVAHSAAERIARVEIDFSTSGAVRGRIRLSDGPGVDVSAQSAVRIALALDKSVVCSADLFAEAQVMQERPPANDLTVNDPSLRDYTPKSEASLSLYRLVQQEIETAWPFEASTVAVESAVVSVGADRATTLKLLVAGDERSGTGARDVLVPLEAPEAMDLACALRGDSEAVPDGLQEIIRLISALGAQIQWCTVLRPTNLPMSALVLLSNGALLNAPVSVAIAVARLLGTPVQINAQLLDFWHATTQARPTEYVLQIDGGGFNHYAGSADLLDGRVRGRPVVGLCGWAWIPERALRNDVPTCPRCLEIYDELPASEMLSELATLIRTLARFARSLENEQRFSEAIHARRRQLVLLQAFEAYQPDGSLAATTEVIEALATDREAAGDPIAALKDWRRAARLHAQLKATDLELVARKRSVSVARDCVRVDAGRFQASLADELGGMARVLDRLNRYDECVAARLEELKIRRELNSGSPGRVRALAATLSEVSRSLEQVGRLDEAVTSALESAKLWRRLREADPTVGRSGHANAEGVVALSFRRLGRPAEALPYDELAVSIYREVSADDTSERANLAIVLSDYIDDLLATGNEPEAINRLNELLRIRRWQAATEMRSIAPITDYPHTSKLAEELDRLSGHLLQTQQFAAAADTCVEEVAVRRRLIDGSDETKASLAIVLGKAGFALERAERLEAAAFANVEAASMWGGLAASYPDLLENQSQALYYAGLAFIMLHREAEAEPYQAEAVEISRRLAEAAPISCGPILIRHLNSYAQTLITLSKQTKAVDTLSEIVAIEAVLVDADPGVHRHLLADALSDLANQLVAGGEKFAEAAQIRADEVELRRLLASGDDREALARLAASLSDEAWALDREGRYKWSLDAYAESAALRQLLAGDNTVQDSDLPLSLHNVAASLTMLERLPEALPIQREAVDILRSLGASPDPHNESVLFTALHTLADLLTACGQDTEAVGVLREAVEVGRRIGAADPGWVGRKIVMRTAVRLGVLLAILDRPNEAIVSFDDLNHDWCTTNSAASADNRIRWATMLGSVAEGLDQVGHPSVPQELYELASSIVRPLTGIAADADGALARFLAGSRRMRDRLDHSEAPTSVDLSRNFDDGSAGDD